MKVINRFSWHRQHGDFAERRLRRSYFRSLGLSFRKIRKDKYGKKPEGYILDQRRRIALVEIKLIKSQKRRPGFQRITIDETVRRAIRTAKKQLKAVDTELPKIIYLVGDEVFLNSESLRQGIFGKWTTIYQGKEIIFNGYSGFHPKYREDDKLRDNLVSAVVCYIPTLDGYSLWIYLNKNSKPIPHKLLDKRHIEELWEYDHKGLKKSCVESTI